MDELLEQCRIDAGNIVSIHGSVVGARFHRRLPIINHKLESDCGQHRSLE